MAKFRRNHKSTSGIATKSFLLLLLVALMGGSLVILFSNLHDLNELLGTAPGTEPHSERIYLPNCDGKRVHHSSYSLCYDTTHGYTRWIGYAVRPINDAHKLSNEQLIFGPDPKLPMAKAMGLNTKEEADSLVSLVPQSDLLLSGKKTMEAAYLSIAIQISNPFFQNVWMPHIMSWHEKASKVEVTYVVTGLIPPLGDSNPQMYRVYLLQNGNELCMESYLFEDHRGTRSSIAVSVDSIEVLTGLDLFQDFILDSLQIRLEAALTPTCLDN